ncbi:hypothetical protein ACTFIZ_002907 [Dictyostelium cf. discoideum]
MINLINDENYFIRKDDKGRTFFHFYCKYKSDENFEEDFKNLLLLGKGPIYYLIENEDEKVSTKLFDFLFSQKFIQFHIYDLPELMYHGCVFDRNQFVKLMVLYFIKHKQLSLELGHWFQRNSQKTIIGSAIEVFINSYFKCLTIYKCEYFEIEMKSHLKLIIYNFYWCFKKSSKRCQIVIGGPISSKSVDPFLMLDAFKSENPNDNIACFPSHPHIGQQTLAYMIDGFF